MDETIIRLSEENNNTSLTQALSSLKSQKVSERDPFSLFITLIVCITVVTGPRFLWCIVASKVLSPPLTTDTYIACILWHEHNSVILTYNCTSLG